MQLDEGKGSIAAGGFAIGMHTGYNAQLDAFVFGFESDMDHAEIAGETEVFSGPIRVGDADKSDGLVEADTRFHAARAGLSWPC